MKLCRDLTRRWRAVCFGFLLTALVLIAAATEFMLGKAYNAQIYSDSRWAVAITEPGCFRMEPSYISLIGAWLLSTLSITVLAIVVSAAASRAVAGKIQTDFVRTVAICLALCAGLALAAKAADLQHQKVCLPADSWPPLATHRRTPADLAPGCHHGYLEPSSLLNRTLARLGLSHEGVSFELMAFGLSFGAALEVRAQIRIRRVRRAKEEGRCVVCGYDLRASPERCPECGMSRATPWPGPP